MDTNDQQYQNLSYTFQNLALSPPPPLAPQPPNGGEFIPQQQQQQQQQHQQREQHQQQHPGSYGYSNGGGGFDPRGPYGDLPPGGGMTSIGRQGWGAQPGIPGGLSMGKSQRGARGGLPSVSSTFHIRILDEKGEGDDEEEEREKGREGRQPNLGLAPPLRDRELVVIGRGLSQCELDELVHI